MKLIDYFYIISRISPKQLVYRLLKIIKNNFIYKSELLLKLLYSKKDEIIVNNSFSLLFNEFFDSDQVKADKILNNEFEFLNKGHNFNEITWNRIADEYSTLWLYELNYFNYASLLIGEYNKNQNQKYIDKLLSLMNNWVCNTKFGQNISWDPYPISRRIVNWINAISYSEKENLISKEISKKIKKSIFEQATFLSSNLEYDLNNNHLTSDAKALIFAGVFFKGKKANEWLQKGLKILRNRKKIEILNDGLQDERSSSYLLVTLKDYLEIYLLLKRNNISYDFDLDKTIAEMFDALLNLIRPDLQLPLLNDSVKDYPINPKELMAVAAYLFNRSDFKYCAQGAELNYFESIFSKKEYEEYINMDSTKPTVKEKLFKDAGYFIYRDGWNKEDRYLVFDFDSINPKHCPGHSHSDELSFELYAGGKALLIDPGVYSYHDPEFREYFKSTRSHNTISINENNKSKLVGNFRVSKTSKSKLLHYKQDDDLTSVKASNIDYKGNTHKRQLDINNGIVLYDEINFKNESENKLESFFQLAPTFTDIKLITNNKVKCYFENVIMTIEINDNKNLGKIRVAESFVSYNWNQLLKSKKIIYELKSNDKELEIISKIKINKN